MPEIKYDPELPFVVLIREDHGDDVILARCSTWDYANQLVKAGTLFREIVDTTPKPKIPEDAEYIFITSEDNEPMFANRDDSSWYWHTTGEYITFRDLVEYIGDAEVTVLVRKEET